MNVDPNSPLKKPSQSLDTEQNPIFSSLRFPSMVKPPGRLRVDRASVNDIKPIRNSVPHKTSNRELDVKKGAVSFANIEAEISAAEESENGPSALIEDSEDDLKESDHTSSNGKSASSPPGFSNYLEKAAIIAQPVALRTAQIDDVEDVQKPSNLFASTNSLGNAKNSQTSVQSHEGIITHWIKQLERTKNLFYKSSYYEFFFTYSNSARCLIIMYTILQLLFYTALILAVNFIMGIELSDLNNFNLIHSLLGIIGKSAFVFSLYLNEIIRKSYIAFYMATSENGVSLTSVALPSNRLNPETGKTLRILCTILNVVLEVMIWLMGYYMEWKPVPSYIGEFVCNPAVYTSPPKTFPGLGDYLQGTSQFALFYSIGLPLYDGIVGGFAQWPLSVPPNTVSFSVEGPGVIYAANAICDPPRVAIRQTYNRGTEFQLLSGKQWETLYTADVTIQLPAGTHNYQPALNSDIIQVCQLVLISGAAEILSMYTVDEFLNSDSGRIQEIKIGGNTGIIVQQHGDYEFLFGDVITTLGVNGTLAGSNMTGWIAAGIEQVFDNQTYNPTQAGSFSNLFAWGTDPDGLYDVQKTYLGVVSAVGLVGHYMLMQYDTTIVGPCQYFGNVGHGTVESPSLIKALVLLAVSFCIVVQISQLFWWILNCQSGSKYDRAMQVLHSPLRLLYDFRHSATKLVTDLEKPGIGDVNLEAKFSTVLVKFGEDRRTRGNEYGKLVLGEPRSVLRVNHDRKYY